MTSDEPDAERTDLQSIPEAQQDISVEEITDADYEVVDLSRTEDRDRETEHRPVRGPAMDPGRTRHTDSIEASSDDLGEDDTHDAYAFEYDSPAATRIGNDDEKDGRTEKLEEYHDERHHAVGDFASRAGEQHKERTAQALCSSLPVTDRERELVVQTVRALDFAEFGQHGSIPKVTLGVVAVIVDEQQRDLNSLDDAVSCSEAFREECDSLGISMSDMTTIKDSVRDALGGATVVAGPSRPRRDPLLPGPTSPKDRPDEYWDYLSPTNWQGIAEQWNRIPAEFKKAIPSRYQSLVDQLRQWEPWNREDGGQPPTQATQPQNDTDGITDEELQAALDGMEDTMDRESTDE